MGNEAGGQNGYYMQMQGEKPVYLLSTVKGENILHPLKYYRKATLFTLSDEELSAVIYQNNGTTYEINRDDQNNWHMIRPLDRNVYQNSLLETIVAPARELEIEEFYDDMRPEECGLVEPTYSLQFSGGQQEEILLIGQQNDQGLCYAKWSNKDGIFGISADILSILQTDPLSYLDRYVYLPEIDTVESFSGMVNGTEFTMEIQRSDDEETYLLNGEQVESGQWKEKFQILLNAEIIGLTESQEVGQPVISYTAKRTDGTTDSVAFFPMGERYFAVSVNNQVNFYVSKNTVNTIIGDFNQ